MKKILLSIAAAALASSAHAQVNWAGSNGTWQSGTQGGFDAVFTDGNSTVFGSIAANNTVTITGTVQPSSVAISNAANTYTFSGGTIGGTGTTLVKSGAGTAQISETTTLSYTGNTTVSAGTLQFRRNTAGTHNIGSGTVNLQGGTLGLGGNLTGNITVQNNFAVNSAGGTIDFTRLGSSSPVWLLTGSMSLGGNLTLFSGGGGSSISSQFYTSGISVDADSTLTYNNSSNSDAVIGSLSGSSARTLAIAVTGSKSLVLAASNAFAGLVKITGPSTFSGTSGVVFTSAPSGNGFAIQTSDNGLASVSYAVSGASDLSNITTKRGGGVRATGANGTFVSLGSDVMNYVGEGGGLVLDNTSSVNNNRLNDSATIALNSTRFTIIGRNSNTSPTNEVVGSLTLNGGSIINLDQTNTNSSGVDLSTTSLAAPTAGKSLLIQTDAGTFGSGAGKDTIVVTGTGANKPTVSNGMISPGIQQYDGANTVGQFVTFSGDELVGATGTNYADNTWASAGSTVNVNVTANTTLTGSGNVTINSLRITGQFNQNLGGRTVEVGSGGFIVGGGTFSNGTISFGSIAGYLGAYNATQQTTFSIALSGSGGITVLGTSQALKLGNATNSFSGGLWVNGGRVSLDVAAAANNNDVTVNALGELTSSVESSSAPAVIGGLAGSGAVKANFQGNNTKNYYLRIAPASGNYTFEGTIANGAAGGILHVSKNGTGTQIFGVNSIGSYTGTTTVNAGTLLINGNMSAATGAVTVASGATLGGNGTIGGATTVNGILAPGNSPGLLTFSSSLTLNGTTTMEIAAAATRGVTYDGINVGTSLAYGGVLTLNFTNTFADGTYNFNLFDFGSQSGNFTSVNLAGSYSGNLTNSGGTWTYTSGSNSTWTFTQSTGDLSYVAAIPEPSTWVLIALSLTSLLVLRRRRHQQN